MTNYIRSKLRLAQRKPNLRATFLKGKLEFKFFISVQYGMKLAQLKCKKYYLDNCLIYTNYSGEFSPMFLFLEEYTNHINMRVPLTGILL